MNDLRFAIRQLLKSPGFTAVAVLTLALGIGANTVIFSVAKAVLFRPLGFVGEDRLMWIRLVNPHTDAQEDLLSWQEMEDIRASTQSFASVATFGSPGAIWEKDDRGTEVPALRVTPNLAEALAIRPVLGRMFVPSDSTDGADPVVLISSELWQSHFGGNPNVLGQSVRLDQKPRTIVGVLPPGLQFPLERAPALGTGSFLKPGIQSFWFPLSVHGEDLVARRSRMYLLVGRLKPQVTEAAARAELAALGQRLAADFPETNRDWSFDLVSFRDKILGRTQEAIPVLAGAVVAVLLICCVNLANLLLARGVKRHRELAVRLALGAGRRRLVQALMLESALLAVLGGGLGIALAYGALVGIGILAGSNVPFIREATIDSVSVLFTSGLSLLTALVFGLLPAWQQARVDAAESLRTGPRTTAGPRVRVWQQGLLAGQIAAVLVLLVSAGLLLESFLRLLGQDLGYQPRSVITLDITTWNFQSNEEVCRFYRDLHSRLSGLPGVEAVGTISSVPLTGKWPFHEKAQVVGEPKPEQERPTLAAAFIAFDYFPALGIPLLEGRFFRDSELKDSGYGQIVVVNQAAATLLFPGRSAIGGRFTVGSNKDRVLEVVGVVKDTRDVRLEEKPQPRFYWQYAFGGAQLVVRSSMPAPALIPVLRDIVQKADPRIIGQSIQSMTEIVSSTVAERRFLMTMLSAYAVLALGMAALGIFGVVAYQVAQRTNEFGIRLALGSSRAALMTLILLQVGRIVLVGLIIGLPLSLAIARLLRSQLFALSPHDPVLFGGACAVLLSIALLASFLPARRAAKVEPMEALRYE